MCLAGRRPRCCSARPAGLSSRGLCDRATPHLAARRAGKLCLASSADAVIGEAGAGHLVRTIDVAQIDEHRLVHGLLEPAEIEGAKLLPFGHDDEGVGTFGATIWPVREAD